MKKNKKYTPFCESKSLDRVINEVVAYMEKDSKRFKKKKMSQSKTLK